MEATMNSPTEQQCNGFTTLDEFIDSLLPDDISCNNQMSSSPHHISKEKTIIAAHEKHLSNSAEIIRSSELPSELNVVAKGKTTEGGAKTIHKPKPMHLEEPIVLQTMMHSMDGHLQPKTNFNSTPSVLYSPPLSPECAINVSMKVEESQMMYPAGHIPSEHPSIMHGIPTFIGDKSFEKSYVYDPKPLTRKTRRALVPEEQKNQKYWMKRMRNNVAARKSREDRRRKELEVLQTMQALQDENQKMKSFINDIVKANEQLVAEMMRMKHQMAFSNGINQRTQSIS